MNEFIRGLSLKIDFNKLTESNYWLSPSPFDDSGFWQEIILLVVVLALISIYVHFKYKGLVEHPSLQKIRKGITKSSIYFSILILLWVFMRTQGIYLLSNRLIGASIVLLWLIWLVIIIYYIWRKFSNEYNQELARARKEKYLPKPQNKKRRTL